MAISATVGATLGSAVIGGVAQSSAASKAAKAQTNAANQANALQQGFFDTTQRNLDPFIATGTSAANKLSQLEGLDNGTGNPANIQSTLQSLPGYQFANTQGLKSTQNAASARGLGTSGAALKGAANFSTGLANTYYNNLLGGVQATENTGANAANGLATAATSTGQGMAANTIGAGAAKAAGDISQGAAVATAANGLPSGLLTAQLLQNQQNIKPTSLYDNINSGGAVSNYFDNANDSYKNTQFSSGY